MNITAAQKVIETGISNTRFHSGVDWLGGHSPASPDGEVWDAARWVSLLDGWLPGPHVDYLRQTGFSTTVGTSAWQVSHAGYGSMKGKVGVMVRGTGFRELDGNGQSLVHSLMQRGLRTRRLDIAYEYFGDEFRVRQLIAEADGGRIDSPVRTIAAHQTIRGSKRGSTLELGSRESERQLVVYDYRGPVRVEHRWYGAKAEAACAVLMTEGASMESVWAEAVLAVLRLPAMPSWERWLRDIAAGGHLWVPAVRSR